MLSAKDNEFISRVGRGTPMGEWLRRFWTPLMLSSQLPEPDCEPRADCTPQNCKQQTLGRHLTEQCRAADPKSNPQRIFLLPLQAAHEQERSRVAAGNYEYKRSRAEEREQDTQAVAVHFGFKRDQPWRKTLEVAVGLHLPCG